MKMKNLFANIMASVLVMAVVLFGFGERSFAKYLSDPSPGIHKTLEQKAVSPSNITFTAIADNASTVQPSFMAVPDAGYLIEGQVQASVALLRSERSSRYAYNYKNKSKSEILTLYKRDFVAINRFVPRLT